MTWLTSLQFAQVEAVHLLWLVAVCIGLIWWLERRGHARLHDTVSPALQSVLVKQIAVSTRRWRLLAISGAMVCMVLALMRPQTRGVSIDTRAPRSDVIVVLDVSKSMLAEDVAPNRLQRAKAEISRLSSELADARLGLVVFAGRAVLSCPLTADGAFFRLALRDVDTSSVNRGGTRIGAAVRMAVEAFPQGLSSKLILLITDGEDHDSYPLEAAQAAAERGVRLVAVGLGSAEGSQVILTDPTTGAKTAMMHDGAPVITKLDSATLQRMADVTDGAYVPVGTAALDLQSVVDAHIVPILRDEAVKQRRSVPREQSVWFVAAAMVWAMLALWLGTRVRRVSAPAGSVALAVRGAPPLAYLMCAALAGGLTQAGCEESRGDEARVRYDEARAQLERGELEAAEAGFLHARSQAGSDAELRYNTAFNLGLLATQRAEQELGQSPPKLEAAAEQFNIALGWFHDAKRLRPNEPEVVTSLERLRARYLATMEKLGRSRDVLERRLDEVLARQRAIRDRARALAEARVRSDAGEVASSLVEAARLAGLQQQATLAELGVVGDLITAGLTDTQPSAPGAGASGSSASEQERAARMHQLRECERYVVLARSAMVDTRRLLRDARGEQAASRANDAVESLKLAREQLLDPIARVRGMAMDQQELVQQVGWRQRPDVPVWLTSGMLQEVQDKLLGRMGSTVAMLQAFAAADASPSADAPESAEALALRKRVELALPWLTEATQAMTRAKAALASERMPDAEQQGIAAIAAMARAIEEFADLRQLIDVAWTSQYRVARRLTDAGPEALAPEEWQGIASVVQDNLRRTTRMIDLLAERRQQEESALREQAAQRAQAAQAGQPNADAAGNPTALDQRFAEAEALRAAAARSLAACQAAVARRDRAALRLHAEQAAETLDQLRRLFLSIVEHLKQLVDDQGRLLDDTEALGERDHPQDAMPPLASTQSELRMTADALAEALAKQADASASASPAQGSAATQGPSSEAWRQAASEVASARDRMTTASTALEALAAQAREASIDVRTVTTEQSAALEALRSALARLQPPTSGEQTPQEREQKSGGESANQPGDKNESEGNSSESNPKPEASQAADATGGQQALQRAGEREAERRRKQQRARTETVEKDW